MRPSELALGASPWDPPDHYDVEEDPERKLLIRAIGIKQGHRLRIGRKEFEP